MKKHLLEKLNAAEQQQCVVFPLCGKSLDMMGVVDAGHRVIGIEGSQMAIEAFFTENQIQYEKEENNQWLVYKVEKIHKSIEMLLFRVSIVRWLSIAVISFNSISKNLCLNVDDFFVDLCQRLITYGIVVDLLQLVYQLVNSKNRTSTSPIIHFSHQVSRFTLSNDDPWSYSTLPRCYELQWS